MRTALAYWASSASRGPMAAMRSPLDQQRMTFERRLAGLHGPRIQRGSNSVAVMGAASKELE